MDSPYDDFVDVKDAGFDEFAKYVLKKKFGKENFRGQQLDVIKKILRVSYYFINIFNNYTLNT